MVNKSDIPQMTRQKTDLDSPPKKVAFLTAGGLAPCLSASVGGLITEYASKHPSTEIICYVNGYQGLLLGNSILVTPGIRATAQALLLHGGSPIGNSRVKLTNVKDCIKRGLVKEGEDPQRVAADQLMKDEVEVLHTIGGDDTNTAAADLSAFLGKEGYPLCVIGLPKTIDNDVFPIQQSLGAWTAAEQGARFFENVVAESSANPRMMIVHEVMGRDCGWLTAATAQAYRKRLSKRMLLPAIGLSMDRLDVHAVYVPEVAIDLEAEAGRLREILDKHDCVNIFISEGAGVKDIVAKMEAEGKNVPRDAFGHVKLDAINPGKYFADTFSALLGAEKVLVQKSGYFARAAPANEEDLALITKSCEVAVANACLRVPGVVGMDEDKGGELRCCEFERIKGGKHFDITQSWFTDMMANIGQSVTPSN
jgi:pyrophosphate--fructose-6-phosphate 1-phosphotransferase